MTKEEIKDYLKKVDELGDKLTGEDKETYDWLIYGYSQCAKLLNETEQQCKKQIKEYQKALDETMSEKIDIEDNWNKLKEYIKKTKLKEFEKSYGKRYGKTFTQAEIIACNMILNKMQELQGSDSDA